LAVKADQPNETIIKILLKAGADPTVKNRKKRTPLDYARDSNNTDIIKMLEDAKEALKSHSRKESTTKQLSPDQSLACARDSDNTTVIKMSEDAKEALKSHSREKSATKQLSPDQLPHQSDPKKRRLSTDAISPTTS